MADQQLFEVDDTLTVGQLTRRLSEAVKRTFPTEIWVQGQIRNINRSTRGHVYFDLVDPVAAGAPPKAAIAVTLFDSNRQVVNRVIKRTGNTVRIEDGVEVRIRGGVEVYIPRGQVQLNMTSIDPEFTLGRLGADREQLLRRLESEGLVDANSSVTMPLVPLRVALITSHGSAAHADFSEQIATSGYAFEVTTLSTRVQGEFAPEEIASMIKRAADSEVDVIAVVRGGGARTDLAAFDTEPVARAIAGSALPVLCGIGHEIDNSVADLVAHRSFKTPTACAQHLIECVVSFDFALAERAEQLVRRSQMLPTLQVAALNTQAGAVAGYAVTALANAQQRTLTAATGLERRVVRTIVRAEQRLDAASTNVTTGADNALGVSVRRCDGNRTRIAYRAFRILADDTQSLDLFEARLSAVDPVQALRRGYSITTTAAGALVRSIDDLASDDLIITRLADGTVQSTVTASPNPTSAEDTK